MGCEKIILQPIKTSLNDLVNNNKFNVDLTKMIFLNFKILAY